MDTGLIASFVFQGGGPQFGLGQLWKVGSLPAWKRTESTNPGIQKYLIWVYSAKICPTQQVVSKVQLLARLALWQHILGQAMVCLILIGIVLSKAASVDLACLKYMSGFRVLYTLVQMRQRETALNTVESHFFGFPLSFSSDSVLKFNSPWEGINLLLWISFHLFYEISSITRTRQ